MHARHPARLGAFLGALRSTLRPAHLRLGLQRCVLCGFPVLLRLGTSEHSVRCPACRAAPAHMALAAVIRDELPRLSEARAYELSSRGALLRFLRGQAREVALSEYFDDLRPGDFRDGVQCQNVESLTHEDESFDLCTSSDVFEHVADDRRGFAELCRVLRPGGRAIFTVPLNTQGDTVERAERRDGEIVNLLPPEYHSDHLRGTAAVLCFRNYGMDITERLLAAGFAEAEVVERYSTAFLGAGRPVIVARR